MDLSPKKRPEKRSAATPTEEAPFLSAFRKMGERLRRMAGTLLANEDDADDALQEAFARLWPRRADIPTEEAASALLCSTVRHLSIDELRRRKVRGEQPLTGNEPPPEAESGERSPADTEALYGEVERLIEEKLTPLQRDILRRKEFRQESYADIAASLQMQETAVRMQLSRARKIIRETYRQRHHGEE